MLRLLALITGMMRLWFTATALFVILVSTAGAAMPLAGTAIDNQAFASFVDQTTGLRSDLSSNIVRVTVAPLEAVLLTDPRTLYGTRNNQIVFSHRLTNTGNTSTTYTLKFGNATGDDFNLNSVALHQDILLNGQLDSGEPIINNNGTVFLYPGQSIDLVLIGTTPSSVTAGQVARLDLRATSTTDAEIGRASCRERV